MDVKINDIYKTLSTCSYMEIPKFTRRMLNEGRKNINLRKIIATKMNEKANECQDLDILEKKSILPTIEKKIIIPKEKKSYHFDYRKNNRKTIVREMKRRKNEDFKLKRMSRFNLFEEF